MSVPWPSGALGGVMGPICILGEGSWTCACAFFFCFLSCFFTLALCCGGNELELGNFQFPSMA